MSDHIPGPGKMVSARDVVARAMLDSIGLSNTSAAQGEGNADAILSALAAAGYAVVPVEPTTDMMQDGQMAARKARRPSVSGMTIDAQVRAECAVEAAVYRAMLAAAKETRG